jgi:hypothetical protein
VLSIITGGGDWMGIMVYADPLSQHLLLTVERKFWRCVQSGVGLFRNRNLSPMIGSVRAGVKD